MKRSKLYVARTLDMARVVCVEAKEQKKREGLPRDRECPEMLDSSKGNHCLNRRNGHFRGGKL